MALWWGWGFSCGWGKDWGVIGTVWGVWRFLYNRGSGGFRAVWPGHPGMYHPHGNGREKLWDPAGQFQRHGFRAVCIHRGRQCLSGEKRSSGAVWNRDQRYDQTWWDTGTGKSHWDKLFRRWAGAKRAGADHLWGGQHR